MKKWFDTERTRYGNLTLTKSAQAAEKNTEHQTWLKDSFSFLQGHIRRKGVSKSSAFKSPQRPSAAAAYSSAFEHQSERQNPTPNPRQSFCNFLHSEIEHLEERDFLTFRNETVKLLSEIQYKAEERKRQVTKSQEVTTYQLPEASESTAGWEYILTIPETQPVSIPVVQPQQTTT